MAFREARSGAVEKATAVKPFCASFDPALHGLWRVEAEKGMCSNIGAHFVIKSLFLCTFSTIHDENENRQ